MVGVDVTVVVKEDVTDDVTDVVSEVVGVEREHVANVGSFKYALNAMFSSSAIVVHTDAKRTVRKSTSRRRQPI